MTDTNDGRLAAVVQAVCNARRGRFPVCGYPTCGCGKIPGDIDVSIVRAAIAADDAHRAARAQGMVTEEVVERAAKASCDCLLGDGSWEQLASPIYKRYTREGTRAALEAIVPLLAPRAPLPAEVTDEYASAVAQKYCQSRGLDWPDHTVFTAIKDALAAAPKLHASGCGAVATKPTESQPPGTAGGSPQQGQGPGGHLEDATGPRDALRHEAIAACERCWRNFEGSTRDPGAPEVAHALRAIAAWLGEAKP